MGASGLGFWGLRFSFKIMVILSFGFRTTIDVSNFLGITIDPKPETLNPNYKGFAIENSDGNTSSSKQAPEL